MYITNPQIFSSPLEPNLYGTIKQEIIADVIIDGEAVIPDNCEWEISDEDNRLMVIISQKESEIEWMAKSSGVYTVSCRIWAENKSVREVAKYDLKFNSRSLFRHLRGKWSVEAKAKENMHWKSTFTFYDDQDYRCSLEEVISGNVVSSFGELSFCAGLNSNFRV